MIALSLNGKRFSNCIIIALIIVLALSSCRSHKDLTMLRNAGDSTKLVISHKPVLYRIKENDNLYVSLISNNPEMNDIYNPSTVGFPRNLSSSSIWFSLTSQYVFGFIVDHEGFITLSGIGKVHVQGMTIEECEKEVEAIASQYLKNVTAKVRLLNFKITVLGEVTRPDVYYSYNTEFTVFDAISVANGVKNTASINTVLVIREVGVDKRKTYRLDLQNTNSLNSEGFNLKPNDVVIVQPAKFKNFELKLPVYSIVISSITTFLLVLNYFKK